METLARTVHSFKLEATEELLTANAELALFGEFERGLGHHQNGHYRADDSGVSCPGDLLAATVVLAAPCPRRGVVTVRSGSVLNRALRYARVHRSAATRGEFRPLHFAAVSRAGGRGGNGSRHAFHRRAENSRRCP